MKCKFCKGTGKIAPLMPSREIEPPICPWCDGTGEAEFFKRHRQDCEAEVRFRRESDRQRREFEEKKRSEK